MTILYEDNLITVCIKQPGISSEDTHNADSVPGQLRLHWGRPDAYVGVVHRLDLGVGGVMVYAHTPAVAAALSRQVADRTMEKEYLCLCAGLPDPVQGQMRDFLFKDSRSHKVFPVRKARKGAKEALLDYTVLAGGVLTGEGAADVAGVDPDGTADPAVSPRGEAARAAEAGTGVAAVKESKHTIAPKCEAPLTANDHAVPTAIVDSKIAAAPKCITPCQPDDALAPAALPFAPKGDAARAAAASYTAPAAPQPVARCRVLLHTGRTHQIRVQFASRKHPLLGDGKYGSRIKGPIALQCSRIAFDHPNTGRRMEFTLPAPEWWPVQGEDTLLF